MSIITAHGHSASAKRGAKAAASRAGARARAGARVRQPPQPVGSSSPASSPCLGTARAATACLIHCHREKFNKP